MKYVLSILALACSVQLAGCADASRSRALGDPRVPGKALAEQVCSNCHGMRGIAQSENFPNLAGQQAAYIEGELRSLRGQHRHDPAGFIYMWGIARNLNDAQIAQLAAYYAAQPAAPAAPPPQADLRAGERLFEQGASDRGLPACAGCHGAHGQGNATIPRLAHQQRGYLLRQLSVLRLSSDNRPLGTVMNSVAHKLNDADIRALADYIPSM